MKWIDRELGKIQMDLREAHSMLARRQFVHEGTDIQEVEIKAGETEDYDHEPFIHEVHHMAAAINGLLTFINDVDWEFHDHFEGWCNDEDHDANMMPT